MHKALYRKWRPQIFEDVIGQDYIVTVLKNQVENGKVGHAYLFTGSRGTGKTSCAKIFAKAVNCEHNNCGDPCLECGICKGVANGSVLDIVEIDAASNTGVDNIRDIIEESAFLPAVCKYRVYIIDEAHMLSTNAFNALLKIMEEPPAHVIFILATTEVHQIPVTIISRCQRFDFSRIEDSLIVSQLLKVAKAEEINLSEKGAQMIASLADGGLRDALSLFDQCASFDNNVNEEVVTKVSGQAEQSFIYSLVEAICAQNAPDALKIIKTAHERSLSLNFITAELISFFRNMMIYSATNGADSSLFKIGTDIDIVRSYAEKIGMEKIMYAISVLSDTLNSLGRSAYPSIAFEQCMITLCMPSLDSSDKALLVRIENLEKQLSSPALMRSPFGINEPVNEPVNEPAVKKSPENLKISEKPVAKTEQKVSATDNSQNGEFDLWTKTLEILSATNTPLFGALKSSRAYLDGEVVYIDTNDFTFALLKGSENNKESLKEAVLKASGKPYKIAQYKPKSEGVSSASSNAMAEILKRAARNGVDVNK